MACEEWQISAHAAVVEGCRASTDSSSLSFTIYIYVETSSIYIPQFVNVYHYIYTYIHTQTWASTCDFKLCTVIYMMHESICMQEGDTGSCTYVTLSNPILSHLLPGPVRQGALFTLCIYILYIYI